MTLPNTMSDIPSREGGPEIPHASRALPELKSQLNPG